MSRLGKLVALGFVGLAVMGISIIMWGVGTSNKLVELEASVDESWAQVENVLQRRNDLIPNLVASVEGSMNQEKEIFTAIADSRRTVNEASDVDDVADANAELNSQLQTLVNVIHESYPELASNKNVQDLMTQLEGTENRISVERKRFNEAVTTYNVTIKKIPTNIVASMSGYEKRDLFEMEEGAEAVPEVNFGVGE